MIRYGSEEAAAVLAPDDNPKVRPATVPTETLAAATIESVTPEIFLGLLQRLRFLTV
jgi:hypothetical protein